MKVLLGLLLGFSLVHPLHISVTEIAFDEKEKELEIIMRVFTDDLETSIRATRKDETIDILSPKGTSTDQLIQEYILPHLAVTLDGKLQNLNYLGHEEEGQALLCYIQVSNVKKWKTIGVRNDAMMEIYDDQSNLINVTVEGEVRSLRLLKNEPSGKITFNSK
jgi:hypothetical protein